MLLPLGRIPFGFFRISNPYVALAGFAIANRNVLDLQVITHRLETTWMSERGFHRGLAGRQLLTNDEMTAGLLQYSQIGLGGESAVRHRNDAPEISSDQSLLDLRFLTCLYLIHGS